MTIEEKLNFKKELKALCVQTLYSRITDTRTAMNEAQQAANSEEKSSAGDKYETGRAMSQIERDNYAAKLDETIQEYNLLNSIDVEHILDEINNGSVIYSDTNIYFIAMGLGIISHADHKVAIISPKSPLANILRGKRVGDSITFNGKIICIDQVF